VALPFAVWKDSVPAWLVTYEALGVPLADWLALLTLAVVAVLVGLVGQGLLLRAARGVVRRTRTSWDERAVELLPGLLWVLIALLVFGVAAPLLDPHPHAAAGVALVVHTLLIVAATALLLRLITLAAEVLEAILTRGVDDENRRRSVHTQLAVPGSILRVVVIVLGAALILLQFDVVRTVGLSLLASAGLAGIIIGLAAQRTVGNLLAGIQLAIFQPIRIGDAVVVEGEYGWVEEIGLTHVVIKVWDLRRLVLPVGYFLERPFQNWTRGASDLLGTVLLYVDYTVSVEAIRAEVEAILRATPLWDGRAQGVQVTNLTRDTVEVRVLVSARDGGQLWDLRCLVREKLVVWLQSGGKGCLPVNRLAVVPPVAVDETPA
jgi:small-conductance mechanosensitive channel